MVEQMTQRWHGESCKETCHSSLKLRGAEVSKLTEALGFGSPAPQSLTGCFPASSPTVCGSSMEQDSVPSSAPQLLSGPVCSSQQMPSIWSHMSRNPSVDAFWTVSLILGICPPQVNYLLSWKSTFLLLVSHQLWYPMRSPWGSPKCQHPSAHHPRALFYATCPILGSPNICGTISAYSCMSIKKRERAQSRGSAII